MTNFDAQLAFTMSFLRFIFNTAFSSSRPLGATSVFSCINKTKGRNLAVQIFTFE